MPPVLEIADLHVDYPLRDGPVHAVRGVSFAVEPGQVVALVGESGAGKSSVGLSVLGILPPPGRITQGRVLFNGQDLARLPSEAMRRLRGAALTMIFQDPVAGLNPVLAVGLQVTEVIANHRKVPPREAEALALEALASLGLADPRRIARAYPGELSGGMCQRVMIAIATVLDPQILVADEPTAALDVTVQAQILEELNRLRRERGTAILLITHDMGVVAALADAVGVMYGGALVEFGAAAPVFRTPRHPYTAALLDTLPMRVRGQERLRHIPGAPPGLTNLSGHCEFLARCPKAITRCRSDGEPPLRPPENDPSGQLAACYNPVLPIDGDG